jgi:biotin synthase
MGRWAGLSDRSLRDETPSRDELLEVLGAGEDQLLPVLHAAYKVRHRFHGNRVRIHVLLNAKSGLCPEDCHFCSQSSISESDIERYKLMSKAQIVEAARKAKDAHAWKFCIVTSTRGPSVKELDTICDAVREIKATVGIKICTSLGHLTQEQADALAAAGVDRFNHNLETSEERFGEVCTTHSYQDRVDTVRRAKAAGMQACSGGIIGMGEADGDIVSMALKAREERIESIPVNILDPRPGTPFGHLQPMPPRKSLLALCVFRFANPSRDIRIAGGREANLKSMWPLALYPCNSIFTSGYLTTPGNAPTDDVRTIREWGFEVEETAPVSV